jgi:hypothetical protein
MSSLPHVAGSSAGTGICQQPLNPILANPILRALLADMDDWITEGVRLPDNRVPQHAHGTLVSSLPQSGMGFPNIPGVNYNGILHTGDLRLSLQQRYTDHAAYVNLVAQAARELQTERLLLEMDVQAYIAAATLASVP